MVSVCIQETNQECKNYGSCFSESEILVYQCYHAPRLATHGSMPSKMVVGLLLIRIKLLSHQRGQTHSESTHQEGSCTSEQGQVLQILLCQVNSDQLHAIQNTTDARHTTDSQIVMKVSHVLNISVL